MDGYAIRADDTAGASDRRPVTLAVGSDAQYVDTGDPLPREFDAVVPIELVEAVGGTDNLGRAQESIRLRSGLTPWQHVRPMGEDIVATEMVLPSGHQIRAIDLGAVAAAGYSSVLVARKPKVAILPTGSEMIPIGSDPGPGEILETNSWVMAAQVAGWGGLATTWPITEDDPTLLAKRIREAGREHDLILVLSGSSAGSKDFTADTVEELGELLVHGIAVRPGHPVILGMSSATEGAKPRPIIGVPGYPVSAALTGEIFVARLLSTWQGCAPDESDRVAARLSRKVHSTMGDEEYLRVGLGRVADDLIAVPLSHGAGVMSSLVEADGIIRIPAGTQGYAAGEQIEVHLYRPRERIERNLLAQGSHDLTLDWITEFLHRQGIQLRSVNVGSLAGLVSLSRGEAHFAGCHLFDPGSGEFNLPYVHKYLSGVPVVLMGLVLRQQGLIVPRGNPLSIDSVESLTRSEVRFINRQRGSGTRILLDHQLDGLGLSGGAISGYERQEFTHLAVAAAVASGTADCGLGIQAAASALGLDFIPIFQERYDLVIRQELIDSRELAPLLELLNDPDFRGRVAELPGYDVEPMGKVIATVTSLP
jgi:putative molybdopterin biosynthesis protein